MFNGVIRNQVKIIITLALFPKYTSAQTSTVKADDGNVEKMKAVIQLNFPRNWIVWSTLFSAL